MKKSYDKIWKLAKPYYEKGRPMDMEHIKWMMLEAEKVCKKERIDDSILMPLVILHDVGYGISEDVYYNKKIKKLHMVDGKMIAINILQKINYPKDKIKKIAELIEIHDYWIYGKYEFYKKNKILWIFNDFDFLWLACPKGFKIMGEILGLDENDMKEYIIKDIRHKKLGFATKTTEEMYKKFMKKL
jgi:hypothetical protein